jgi:hypothetical protein
MYYGFQTSDENAAIGALLVYGIYRSRDIRRFKVTPDMWGMIERAVKSSAKRAMDLTDFIEKLKDKLKCSTLKPQYMATDTNVVAMHVDPVTGEIVQVEDKGKREFWVDLLENADDKAILERLYAKTSLIIALVRDRLEREKALELKGIIKFDEEENEDEED